MRASDRAPRHALGRSSPPNPTGAPGPPRASRGRCRGRRCTPTLPRVCRGPSGWLPSGMPPGTGRRRCPGWRQRRRPGRPAGTSGRWGSMAPAHPGLSGRHLGPPAATKLPVSVWACGMVRVKAGGCCEVEVQANALPRQAGPTCTPPPVTVRASLVGVAWMALITSSTSGSRVSGRTAAARIQAAVCSSRGFGAGYGFGARQEARYAWHRRIRRGFSTKYQTENGKCSMYSFPRMGLCALG